MPHNRYETMYLWLAGGMLLLFAIALSIGAGGLGIELPTGSSELEYDDIAGSTGLHEISADRYEVYLTASESGFEPEVIDVPVNAEVTFFIGSEDMIRGFKVENTTLSVVIIPGHIAEASYTFTRVGEYQFYCHEYCGTGQHEMTGVIRVNED
jgi:cytochrome c oxidase subunit II